MVNNNELYHYGVLGMKWGVRQYQNKDGTLTKAGKKREAKQQYKKSKVEARTAYRNATSKADAEYEQAMSRQKEKLKAVNKEYDKKQKIINDYYNKELEKYQDEADSAKEYMDFWGKDSRFGDEYASKYNKATKKIEDTHSRYDAATIANDIARDKANIKVKELYYDSSKKASANLEAAYTKAGEDYVKSLNLAKMTYKETIKQIKGK